MRNYIGGVAAIVSSFALFQSSAQEIDYSSRHLVTPTREPLPKDRIIYTERAKVEDHDPLEIFRIDQRYSTKKRDRTRINFKQRPRIR